MHKLSIKEKSASQLNHDVLRMASTNAGEDFAEKICGYLDFDYFAVCHIDRMKHFNRNSANIPSFQTNFPRSWVDHYLSTELIKSDPIFNYAPRTTRAQPWDDIRHLSTTTKENRMVLDEAANHGISSGLCMGTLNLNGDMQIISFANKVPREFSSSDRQKASLLGLSLADAVADEHASLAKTKKPEFTAREIECLTWVAIGKSSYEIGMILGISHNTVDFHVKNVMNKLDASSRTFAVVKALRIGLIDP